MSCSRLLVVSLSIWGLDFSPKESIHTGEVKWENKRERETKGGPSERQRERYRERDREIVFFILSLTHHTHHLSFSLWLCLSSEFFAFSVFPAGILQPTLYDPEFPQWVFFWSCSWTTSLNKDGGYIDQTKQTDQTAPSLLRLYTDSVLTWYHAEALWWSWLFFYNSSFWNI